MRHRSRGAKWFVVMFYILAIELFVIARLNPFPIFWLSAAPWIVLGLAALLMVWDLRLIERKHK